MLDQDQCGVADMEPVAFDPPRRKRDRRKTRRSPRPRQRIEVLLEMRTGVPFTELCEECARQGMSRRDAAKYLGTSEETFRNALRRTCPELEWPAPGQSRIAREGYKKRRNIGEEKRAKTTAAAILERLEKEKQQELPVMEERELWRMAQEADINCHIVMHRYRRGLRGKDLLAPAREGSEARCTYSVGIPMRRWEPILRFARDHGELAAAERYPVPLFAIIAMLTGEEELVG